MVAWSHVLGLGLVLAWVSVHAEMYPLPESQVLPCSTNARMCNTDFSASQSNCGSRTTPTWSSICLRLDQCPHVESATSIAPKPKAQHDCQLAANDIVHILESGAGKQVEKDSAGFYSIIRIRVVRLDTRFAGQCQEGGIYYALIGSLGGAFPGWLNCAAPYKPPPDFPMRTFRPCPKCNTGTVLRCDNANDAGCCTAQPGQCTCPNALTDPLTGCFTSCARGFLRCNNQGDCSTGAGKTRTSEHGANVPFVNNPTFCRCQDGYFGTNCERTCGGTGSPCSGHGQCVTGLPGRTEQQPPQPSDDLVCVCNAGFAGPLCAASITPCVTATTTTASLCQGRGVCVG